MAKPKRSFSASIGQRSTGSAGPDQIEYDLDQAFKMFDPTETDGGIRTENIVDASITTVKIADANVTAAKIADSSITTAKISDGSVSTVKIADGSVDANKLAASSVTNAKISNGAVDINKVNTASLDSRYYTELEIDTRLSGKSNVGDSYTKSEADGRFTNQIGDHKGTWQGLTPGEASEAINGARLDVLEADVSSANTLLQSYNRGQTAITADQDTPFNVTRIEGKTTINHVPLFKSGFWGTNPQVTYDSDTKATIVSNGTLISVETKNISVKQSTSYMITAKINTPATSGVYVDIMEYDSNNAVVVDGQNINNSTSYTFTTSPTTSYIKVRIISEATVASGTSTIENVMLNEGTTAQEFVANVKGLTGAYAQVVGKNLIPPFSEWKNNNTPVSVSIKSPYEVDIVVDSTFDGIAYDLDVLPSTQYVLSGTKTAIGSATVSRLSSDGVLGSNYAANNASDNYSIVFTTDSDAKKVRISLTGGSNTSGTFTFTNPQLELGSTATAFEAQRKSYASLPTTLHSLNGVSDEYDAETNTVNRRFKEVVLDGSLGWRFDFDYSGFKRVAIDNFDSKALNTTGSLFAVKYDGKVISNYIATHLQSDTVAIDESADIFYLSISDTDSGFPDSYTPSSGEISAMMWGWKMCNPDGGAPWDGVSTKSWKRNDGTVTGNSGGSSSITSVLPVTSWDGWKPGKLIYQQASATQETVQLIGDAMLSAGTNTVTVGEGLVQREVAKPVINNSQTFVYINLKDGVAGLSDGSKLNNRAEKILAVYKGNDKDSKWSILVSSDAYGKEYARIPIADFDKTAVYYVDLIAEPYAYSSSILSLDAEYSKNIRSTVNELVKSEAEHVRRIDVIETTYARKAQPGWIAPTLLNGWTNTGGSYDIAGYKKNDFGEVSLKAGRIQGGSTADATVLFYLPIGYRPKAVLTFLVKAYTTANTFVHVEIHPTGQVQIRNTQAIVNMSLDGISFQAEQ